MIFEGAISVKAILEGKKRKINYIMIDVNKKDRNTDYIIKLAKKNNVEIKFVNRNEIDALATSKTHGGIIIDAENRINDELSKLKLKNKPTIYILEGVEDPFNLGYAIRSLYAFGATALIIKNQHLISSENIIVKSSAGASEKLPIIVTDDLVNDIKYLKTRNLKFYLCNRTNKSVSYFNANYDQGLIIGLGGEKRGFSKDIESLSDQDIYIPYANDFRNALNLTSACVCIASKVFEIKFNK